MSTIDEQEMFQNVTDFLKTKGIELKEGSYTRRIRQGCRLLTKAVNTTDKVMEKAKVEMDAGLDRVRQKIHEKTAPKPRPAAETSATPPAPEPPPSQSAPAPEPAKAAPRPPKAPPKSGSKAARPKAPARAQAAKPKRTAKK